MASPLLDYGTKQIEYTLYFVANIALCASSAFALAHLLSFCSVEFSELKRVFIPIEENYNTPFTH